MTTRARIAGWLRRIADRIDPPKPQCPLDPAVFGSGGGGKNAGVINITMGGPPTDPRLARQIADSVRDAMRRG